MPRLRGHRGEASAGRCHGIGQQALPLELLGCSATHPQKTMWRGRATVPFCSVPNPPTDGDTGTSLLGCCASIRGMAAGGNLGLKENCTGESMLSHHVWGAGPGRAQEGDCRCRVCSERRHPRLLWDHHLQKRGTAQNKAKVVPLELFHSWSQSNLLCRL